MPSQCAHGGVPLWCFPSRPLPALVGRALWLWLAVHLFGSAFGSAFESAFFGSYGSAFCYVSLLLEFSAFSGSAFDSAFVCVRGISFGLLALNFSSRWEVRVRFPRGQWASDE